MTDEVLIPDISPKVQHLLKLYKRAEEWEQNTRNINRDDLKFAHADSDNGFQWPPNIRQSRDVDQRPCLTINEVRQHNLLIKNAGKMNTPQIKFVATGDGASVESAEAWNALVYHIQYASNANSVYNRAMSFQVDMGMGYWRVNTAYESDDSFNQVVTIEPIPNPFNVYFDPDIQQEDGSDARYAVVFDDVPRDKWKMLHPKYADLISTFPLDNNFGWVTKDYVRIAEFFVKEEKRKTLVGVPNKETGELLTIFEDEIPEQFKQLMMTDPLMRKREVVVPQMKWYLVAGTEIVEEQDWEGKYVPIIRCPGEEVVLDGIYDRSGHTRAMKDPQRMYNYWSSSAVEHVALQSKIPWIAPVASIEGYETLWETANTENYSVLPYNAFDEDGQPLPMPQRMPPPTMAEAYLQGMQITRQEIMMASGQYQNSLGQQGNERTGKAIINRQKQGDTATYHFQYGRDLAVRFTGIVIQDLVPKIYDTKRLLAILNDDQSVTQVIVDPNAPQAGKKVPSSQPDVTKLILNPTIGKYLVQVKAGPGFESQMEEQFESLMALLTQAPQYAPVIGDLLFASSGFPKAGEIAQRLKRMVPLAALGEGPPPEMQQLQQQMQQMQQLLAQLTEENATLRIAKVGKDEANQVGAYKALTERFKVLSDHENGAENVRALLAPLVQEMMTESLDGVFDDNPADNPDEIAAQAASQPGQMSPAIAQMFKPEGGQPGG